MKAWLKGGLIGLGLALSSYLMYSGIPIISEIAFYVGLFMYGYEFYIPLIYKAPNVNTNIENTIFPHMNPAIFSILMLFLGLLYWSSIGALIGLIIGNIWKHSRKNKDDSGSFVRESEFMTN